MQEYRSNKLKTAWEICRRIENWPTAWGLRLRRHHPGLRLLAFRDGFNVACRGGSRDWDVVHELFFAGGYHRAMQFLKQQSGAPVVLDLGGNIGTFALLAARSHAQARGFSYEPGPPNFRMFEMNRLANPALMNRIELRREAVGGHTRDTEWTFDEANPGGSGFYATGGSKFAVRVTAFAEVLKSLPGPVALAKIDIEGAEFELLEETPLDVWRNVGAVSLELHDDPAGRFSREQFLERFRSIGFKVEEESVVSLFLHR
jgi:FkbM family methyltransferase